MPFLPSQLEEMSCFFAGHGTNDDRWDGGNGGSIELIAGGGHGRNQESDAGGDVSITCGAAASSKGGSFLMKSGPSLEGSSGNLTIATDYSGSLGVSGSVNISTGFSNWGASGDMSLQLVKPESTVTAATFTWKLAIRMRRKQTAII